MNQYLSDERKKVLDAACWDGEWQRARKTAKRRRLTLGFSNHLHICLQKLSFFLFSLSQMFLLLNEILLRSAYKKPSMDTQWALSWC